MAGMTTVADPDGSLRAAMLARLEYDLDPRSSERVAVEYSTRAPSPVTPTIVPTRLDSLHGRPAPEHAARVLDLSEYRTPVHLPAATIVRDTILDALGIGGHHPCTSTPTKEQP